MKYLIYSRVSTEKQDTETQLRMCLEYMEYKHPKGDYTYKIFDEGDLTSQLPMRKRPKLQEMLSEVKKGVTVLVYELSRLARDVLEQVTIYRLITRSKEKEGKEAFLHSLQEPGLSELTVGILGSVAQDVREKIQEKTKDKLKTKKIKGERYSRFLPYGYALHETKTVGIREGDKIVQKRGILIPVHEEQQALSKIYSFAGSGLSYQWIADELGRLGYFNREGKPFHKNTIYRIIKRKDTPILPCQSHHTLESQQMCLEK